MAGFLTRFLIVHRSSKTGSLSRWSWIDFFFGYSPFRALVVPSESYSRVPRCTTLAEQLISS